MNRIKELRQSNGLSQAELAKKINVHQTAISQWEKGRTNPDVSAVVILADVLESSADYILGRTNDPAPTSEKKIAPKISGAPTAKREALFIEARKELSLLPDEDLERAIEILRALKPK